MTARTKNYEQGHVPDMERRLANMVRNGKISAISYGNPAGPRVKVKSGDIETGWIPTGAERAGEDSTWSPRNIGESVVIVSPSGDLAQAVVVCSVHNQGNPAPGIGGDLTARKWGDGAMQTYDKATGTLHISAPPGGRIVLSCGDSEIIMSAAGVEINGVRVDFN